MRVIPTLRCGLACLIDICRRDLDAAGTRVQQLEHEKARDASTKEEQKKRMEKLVRSDRLIYWRTPYNL